MITFKLQTNTIKQLKKFINGWDTPNEHLYLHTDVDNNLYLILFDNNHIYISYLRLGNTKELQGTYELNDTYYEDGNPKELKKFISKQKELEINISDKSLPKDFQWIGVEDTFHSSTTPCDLNLDLDYFLTGNKTFHIKKQDFKVLDLYKNHNSCIYFKKGKIEFKIYDKDYNVFAKHIICDNYNNTIEEHYHLSNKLFLQLLRKFNSKDQITIKFDDREPLVIQSEDYIGIIAPRIIYEEGYGSTDGLYDKLGGD